MSGVGGKGSGITYSDIDTCGVSQTTATSPTENGSQFIKGVSHTADDSSINDVSNNIEVSNHEASQEQPLHKSATGLAKDASEEQSSASVWWHYQLDRLENAEKCYIGCKNL